VGGQLVGSVSYGLSAAPSKIGGLTPAEDMVGLLGLPAASIAARSIRVDLPRRVSLRGALGRTVAQRAELASSSGAALTQLKVPLSVSGLGPRGLDRVSSFVTRPNPTLVPYAGSSASRTAAAAPGTLMPGDSFASVASYGESSVAAVGTVTYVCDGVALAFGHPFEFGGAGAPSGANAADALAVVPDSLTGSYKLANVAETLGVVDQDRLAGLRAKLGATPSAFPVHTVVNASDLGRRREAESQVVMPDWASTVALFQLFGGLESTADSAGTGFDSAGRGTASAWWTFQGTRSDGSPWSITRGDRWASRLGVDFTTAFNIAVQLDELLANSFEGITVTNVKVSVTREQAFRLFSVRKVLVSKNGGRFTSGSSLAVRPGMRLRVRIVLRSYSGGADHVLQYRFRVSRRALGGTLFVGGNRPSFFEDCVANQVCFVFSDFEDEDLSSFDELLQSQKRKQRNDVVSADLVGNGNGTHRETRLPGMVVGQKIIRFHPQGTPTPDEFFFLRAP